MLLLSSSKGSSSSAVLRNSRLCFSTAKKTVPKSSTIAGGYLQDTVIPTYHFQKSLLRLPIPKLEDTVSRYLDAVQPITTAEDFSATVAAAKDFEHGVGKDLHNALVNRDKASPHTSYINQWWKDMYVSDRQPLVINVNPQIRLRDDPNALKNTQLQRATSLIASSLRFFITLRDEKLVPDIFHTKKFTKQSSLWEKSVSMLPESISFYGAAAFGAYPLDMSQYQNLFQSTRIPKQSSDVLKTYDDSTHIVIQRGTNFYSLQVLDSESKMPLSDSTIHSGINEILAMPVGDRSKNNGVGLFTTMERDDWARARENLVSSSHVNKASLDVIDSALFAVCLEDTAPTSTTDLSRTFLYGSGSNHWFDKSFQLIIAANGKASLNFEHAWGDGVAVLRYLNETMEDSICYDTTTSSSENPSQASSVKKLEWELNDASVNTLHAARKKFDSWTSRLFIESAESSISRDIAKKYNVGIDGVLQMTIQLAHYKLNGSFESTYESASTSAFKHGRTETVRSCTNEAVSFVKTMIDSNASNAEKEKAFRKALKKHAALTKNGVMGQGCDRHLFGMKQMALMNSEEPLPELFTMSSAEKMNKIILSTSTLSSPHLEGGSFGPVNPDCYGVGYGMEESSLFQLSSYKSDAGQFSELLVSSLHEIVDMLEAGNRNSK